MTDSVIEAETAAAEAIVAVAEEFGVVEGEVDKLEQKWVNWSEDIEENKRLVIDDIDEVVEASPFNPNGPQALAARSRRRSRAASRTVQLCPIFYGWVVAGLVALGALIVSPAQVYCIGVVLDAMQEDLGMSRVQISTLYAAALLFAAPVILLHMRALSVVSRKTLILMSGCLFCLSCILLATASGQISLLLTWTLQQFVGPGMLYPALELTLLHWWNEKRDIVSAVVQSAGALLGMLFLPGVLSSTACPDGACWRTAYFSLGFGLLAPLLLIALLQVDGGAIDHGERLDGLSADAAPLSPAAAAKAREAPETPQRAGSTHVVGGEDAELMDQKTSENAALPSTLDERWTLHDALTHTSFWLAQVTFSTVHGIINAFIFHRDDLMRDVGLPKDQSLTLLVVVGLSCMVCTPAGLFVRRKEHLLLLALLLTAFGLLTLVHDHTTKGLYISSTLMGCAFGVTNGYATVIWEYFFGRADAERIKHTSIAITSATSGSAIWAFAFLDKEMGGYRWTMNAFAIFSLVLAGCDMLALAKPELLEAIVRHAPTWEQLLARRQRSGYFSVSGQLVSIARGLGRCLCPASAPGSPPRNQANPIEREIPSLDATRK